MQDELELGQGVLGHFVHEEPDDDDEMEDEMEDNNDLLPLDGLLLDLNEGVAVEDNLPVSHVAQVQLDF